MDLTDREAFLVNQCEQNRLFGLILDAKRAQDPVEVLEELIGELSELLLAYEKEAETAQEKLEQEERRVESAEDELAEVKYEIHLLKLETGKIKPKSKKVKSSDLIR